MDYYAVSDGKRVDLSIKGQGGGQGGGVKKTISKEKDQDKKIKILVKDMEEGAQTMLHVSKADQNVLNIREKLAFLLEQGLAEIQPPCGGGGEQEKRHHPPGRELGGDVHPQQG
jgi:hypothetical protein